MSPDSRGHRGPHPQDAELFAERTVPKLREATRDLGRLLGRRYADTAALKLVGDRFQLHKRQRHAIRRAACAPSRADARRRKRLAVEGASIAVDGFNVLVTLEAALGGGVLIRGHDGLIRDLSSMHGTYRKVAETARAIELLTEALAPAKSVRWVLDRPVSNSGRVAAMLRDAGFEVALAEQADTALATSGRAIATADGPLLDRAEHGIDLTGPIVAHLGCRVIDLCARTRVIAVDWSGAAARSTQRRAIWIAEVEDGVPGALRSGLTRAEVADTLEGLLTGGSALVGLDFAFSFPGWFVRSEFGDVEAAWRLDPEHWLAGPRAPFWRARGAAPTQEVFRRTERASPRPRGQGPESVFKCVGAKQVGPGSVRGMPVLRRLRDAGYAIWPFDDAGSHTLFEIYPRVLADGVKGDRSERVRRLDRLGAPAHWCDAAIDSADAFDAAISALVMARHVEALAGAKATEDPIERLEGRIWQPPGSPRRRVGPSPEADP